MKYLVVLVVGGVLGAVTAAALLMVNPLTRRGGAEIEVADLSWRHALPESYLALTHGGTLPGPRIPAEVDELWEKAVERSALAVVALSDEQGVPAAVASRVAWPAKRSDLLTGGLIVDDLWLVTVPGRGSMFVTAESNLWPVLADTLVSTRLLRRPFDGPRDYRPVAGPSSARLARVRGATLEFDGMTGVATEHWRIEGFDATAGLERLSGELRIEFDRAADADAIDEPVDDTVGDPLDDGTGAGPGPAPVTSVSPAATP